MNRDRTYNLATRGFSLVFVGLGLAMLAVTLSNGGTPASTGFILGVLFLAVGIGRLWISTRGAR